MIGHIRLGLLCVAWMAALIQVTTGADLIEVVNLGVIAFIAFVILTLSRLRHDSALILLLLVVVGWALLDHFPDGNEWASGGRYVLIFAALLPTMALVRATASMMPSVHRTQDALAQLPASASSGGLHLAANIFGGIMRCDVIAEGVIAAVTEVGLKVPLVVRLEARLPAVQRDGRHAGLHGAWDVCVGSIADLPLFIIIIHDPVLVLRQVGLLVHARDRLAYQFVVLVHDDARELALLVRRVQAGGVVDRLVAFIRLRALVGPRQLLDLGPGLPSTRPAEVARGAGGRHDGCPGRCRRCALCLCCRVTRQRPFAAPVPPRCVMRCVCAGPSRAARCACLWAARSDMSRRAPL